MNLERKELTCPKCGFAHQTPQTECQRCGVIFKKVQKKTCPAPPQGPKGHETFSDEDRITFYEHEDESTRLFFAAAKGLFLLILGLWGIKLAAIPFIEGGAANSFLHHINLPFHEAGHVIFRPFGPFLHSLGGTLGQLLIPIICMLTLLFKTKDSYGAAVCLWWTGENFLDIAPYADDARRLSLPLLGGNFGHSSPYGFHDWEFLLTESGLLAYDHAIANFFKNFGLFLMAISLVWGGVSIYKKHLKS